MKLVNADWMLEIIINENIPAILVLENSEAMTEIVEDFYNLCLKGEGTSVLSDDLKVISFEKVVELVINPFAIDFNSKRIQSKLYIISWGLFLLRIESQSSRSAQRLI